MVAPSTFPCSSPSGISTYASSPAEAAFAATLLARLPVERAAHGLESQLDGLRQRDGHDAVLEGERRVIDRVVLDVQLGHAEGAGQSVGADERRAADLPADGRLAIDRQELVVPPHRAGPRRDRFPVQRPRDRLVVVRDLQRAEVLRAEVRGLPSGTSCRTGDTSNRSLFRRTPVLLPIDRVPPAPSGRASAAGFVLSGPRCSPSFGAARRRPAISPGRGAARVPVSRSRVFASSPARWE